MNNRPDFMAITQNTEAKVLPDAAALDAIAALLNGSDWSSDYIEAVADMVRSTGRTISDI